MGLAHTLESGLRRWGRKRIQRRLLDREILVMRDQAFAIAPHFREVDTLGLYLHIPFCRQICPYCPYNKVLYDAAVAHEYAGAVLKEVDCYAANVVERPVTSFYIGGGTPTTMLHTGLPRILRHIYHTFDMRCAVHMESHPNDLSAGNLQAMVDLGVEHLSIGVEALQDRHLRTLCRPYQAAEARAAVERAVAAGFRCVNVDLIFALPGQTHEELQQAASMLVDLGVGQITAYPLFVFPYTRWPEQAQRERYPSYNLVQKRRMLRVVEQVVYPAGYERTSVWAFTRAGVPKYCSVTVPLYLGLGASAGSYLRDIFYLNTFNVQEYIRALAEGRLPIALSLELSQPMQMAGWLYWRIYETRFKKSEFWERFQTEFDAVYGQFLKPLSRLGWLAEHGDETVLTDAGAYWLHAVQDWFSIDYVSHLWGISQVSPWPRELALQ